MMGGGGGIRPPPPVQSTLQKPGINRVNRSFDLQDSLYFILDTKLHMFKIFF